MEQLASAGLEPEISRSDMLGWGSQGHAWHLGEAGFTLKLGRGEIFISTVMFVSHMCVYISFVSPVCFWAWGHLMVCLSQFPGQSPMCSSLWVPGGLLATASLPVEELAGGEMCRTRPGLTWLVTKHTAFPWARGQRIRGPFLGAEAGACSTPAGRPQLDSLLVGGPGVGACRWHPTTSKRVHRAMPAPASSASVYSGV